MATDRIPQDALQDLIAPVPVAEFLRSYWDERALYIPGGADKFSSLGLDLAAFHAAVKLPDARVGLVIKAVYADAAGRQNEISIGPDLAADMYKAGMSIYVANMHVVHRPFARLSARLERQLGLPEEMTFGCVLSGEERGFGTHFDNNAVMILQIEGEKRWLHGDRPAVVFPTEGAFADDPMSVARFRGAHPWEDLRIPSETDLLEHLLRPGDLLYMPAGTWHRTRARGHSLSISMSFPSVRFDEIVARALRRGFRSNPGWRRSLPLVLDDTGAHQHTAEARRRFIDERLTELRAFFATATAAELEPPESPRRPPAELPLADVEAPLTPGASLRLGQEFPLQYNEDISDDGDVVLLVHYGDYLVELSRSCLPLLEAMVRARAFRAEEAMAWGQERTWTWEEVASVLRPLIDIGVVKHA